MKKVIKNIIRSDKFNEKYFKTGNYENYEENARFWTGRVARQIKRTSKKPRPRILDVGCAHGYLMTAAQNIGCDVEGLEYSDYVIKEAIEGVRGKIKKGSILRGGFKNDEFDVVACFNVLEYIPEEKIELALNNLVKWTNDLIFFTTCFKHSRYSSQKHSPDELRMTIKTEKEWIELFHDVGAAHLATFYDGGGGDVLIFTKKHGQRN